jgi:hypothetical protein
MVEADGSAEGRRRCRKRSGGREANLFWGCGGKAGELRGRDARAKGEGNDVGQGKCGDKKEMCWSWEM